MRIEDDWQLNVPCELRRRTARARIRTNEIVIRDVEHATEHTAELRGRDALVAVGKLLPALNAGGARSKTVSAAVQMLEDTPDTRQLFLRFAGPSARSVAESRRDWISPLSGGYMTVHDPDPADTRLGNLKYGVPLRMLPTDVRLALEMAAPEESERRAMEGELALLTQAWREAAEIAQCSDDMFVPDSINRRIDEMKSSKS